VTAGAVLAVSARFLVRFPWLVLLAAVVLVPLHLLEHVTGNWWWAFLTGLARLIVEGTVIAIALMMMGGTAVNVIAAVGVALRRVPVLWVATILSSLGIAVGLALLVIPGLVLLTRWSVVFPVLVNERSVGLGLERSWQLVRGRSWVAFWATLVPTLVLISFVLAILFLDGWAWALWVAFDPFLLSYSTIVAVVLYRWLVGATAGGDAA
jgi:hypothetical protein